MPNTRTYTHTRQTLCDADGNENILFQQVTLADVIASDKSEVTAVGKVLFSGTCSTAAATAAKTMTVPGYSLVTGAHLTALFTNAISSANSTLSINGGSAYPLRLNGTALPAGVVLANNNLILQFDGSAFNIVGGAGSVKVSPTTNTRFFLIGVPTEVNGTPTEEFYRTGMYVSAEGMLTAPSFSGVGTNITQLNATNISTGTLSSSRLADSGATAGTYGTTTAGTLNFGGTFNIPSVEVDAKGRVTGISNVSLTLPANPDTDVKVTTTVANTTRFYLAGSSNAATETGTLLKDTGIYADTTAGRLVATSLWSATLYFASSSAYINATSYTGQAATVASITNLLRDNLTGNGVSNMALTANQGYVLNAAISNVNSTVSGHTTSISSLNTTVGNHTTSINSLGTRMSAVESTASAANTRSTTNATNITSINNKLGTQVTFTLSGTTLTIKPK